MRRSLLCVLLLILGIFSVLMILKGDISSVQSFENYDNVGSFIFDNFV